MDEPNQENVSKNHERAVCYCCRCCSPMHLRRSKTCRKCGIGLFFQGAWFIEGSAHCKACGQRKIEERKQARREIKAFTASAVCIQCRRIGVAVHPTSMMCALCEQVLMRLAREKAAADMANEILTGRGVVVMRNLAEARVVPAGFWTLVPPTQEARLMRLQLE